MAQDILVPDDFNRTATPLAVEERTIDADPLADGSKHYVVEPHIIGLTDVRDDTLRIERKNNVIVIDDGDGKCQAAMCLEGKRCAVVKTNDNGACAVHAVFGSPGIGRELYHPHARELIGELLGTSLSELKSKLGEEHQFLQPVMTSLWSEFAEPWFAELGNPEQAAHAGKEAMMFMQELYRREPVRGYAKAQTRYNVNSASKRKKAQCVAELKIASRSIFRLDLEASFWRPYAINGRIIRNIGD